MFRFPDYTYRAKLIRVIDGDTVDVWMDLGCYTYKRSRLRLKDITTHRSEYFDTDELRRGSEEEKQRGREARERMSELLGMGDMYVKTMMDAEGKYGRLLAHLYIVEDVEHVIDVINTMVHNGHEKGMTGEYNTEIIYELVDE